MFAARYLQRGEDYAQLDMCFEVRKAHSDAFTLAQTNILFPVIALTFLRDYNIAGLQHMLFSIANLFMEVL